MKTYRVFIDVRAENKDEAKDQAGCCMANGDYRIQEDPLTDEEEGTVLEIARLALIDKQSFYSIADKCDLSDNELKKLLKKIEKITNRT